MKKHSAKRRSANRPAHRTRTKFTKSWLEMVKLEDLSVLADSGDGGCYGGSWTEDLLVYVTPGGPNGDPPPVCADSYTLCCPCNSFLGTDTYFGFPACCDMYYMQIAGVVGGGGECPGGGTGTYVETSINNPGYPPYAETGNACNQDFDVPDNMCYCDGTNCPDL